MCPLEILQRLVPLVGILFFIGISLAVSTNRRAAMKRWDLILWGVGLQIAFALIILKWSYAQMAFAWFNDAFVALIGAADYGSYFVLGQVTSYEWAPAASFATTDYVDAAVAHAADPTAPPPRAGFFNFAFMLLPTIIFFSALTSVLYHLGILQLIVRGIAWVMQKTLKTSGAETLSASANIFVGQTEAPLMVKPFLSKMTNSELMTVMTGGFATVAGGVMALYVFFLKDTIPGIAGHLLAASIMSAPAALLFGKLMVPEEEIPETSGKLEFSVEKESVNLLDAASIGTTDGLRLALNVGAMLIAFLALIALVDLMLGGIGGFFSDKPIEWLNLRSLAGMAFTPIAFMIGIIDPKEAYQVGQLLGIKLIANEVIAYSDLAGMLAGENPGISQRSGIIATYALCGFANIGSIGIQIGGIAALAPDRRKDLSRLALRAMIAGSFAANTTGCVAAILL